MTDHTKALADALERDLTKAFRMGAASIHCPDLAERITADFAAFVLDTIAAYRAAQQAGPIDMVLHCPACGLQHIDAPDERTPDWKNEPHRSHLCHGCGHIWRPADVPTNGVIAVKTKGKADSPIATPAAQAEPVGFNGLTEAETAATASAGGMTPSLTVGDEPVAEGLPHPGSPEASAMIDSVLAEYQWPTNAKNATRAGYVAARRLMQWARKPLPDFDAPPQPAAQAEPVAWIEHDYNGTGQRRLHFERRPATVRDEVVAPIWTPLVPASNPPAQGSAASEAAGGAT